MAVDTAAVLLLVKTRLNRLDNQLDMYLTYRIQSAMEQLNRMMPEELDDSTADSMLLVDFTVWQYQNRDKSGAMPEWLRIRLRERHLYRKRDES